MDQLFDAGGPVRWWLRRRDLRVANGDNKRRMRERAAKQKGMTLQQYEQWRIEQDAERERRQQEREVRPKRVVLSDEERLARKRASAHKSYRKAYDRDPTAWYAAAYRRRAKLKSASVIEEIRRRDVFERDGWRCRYCGKKVSDKVKRGHKHKAVMAHIVALDAGGDHSWDNVCCLCHECNCKDGVNKLPIQKHLL